MNHEVLKNLAVKACNGNPGALEVIIKFINSETLFSYLLMNKMIQTETEGSDKIKAEEKDQI